MRLSILSLIAIGLCALVSISRPPAPPLATLPPPAATIHYESHPFDRSVVHTLLIPAGAIVTVAVADELEPIAHFVEAEGAIAVLNGGFFDPVNGKSTSYVMRQGQIVADPRQNDRLMNNPDLTAYLDQILDRSEFRRYQCGRWSATGLRPSVRYAIVRHHQPIPVNCQLVDSLGAGSQLLPDLTLQPEGFLDIANGQVIRDSLGSRQPNARTAIGIKPDGSLVWAMVAQIDPSGGMTLSALADYMRGLGVTIALNLDGGSSAALYYDGNTVHGKVNQAGRIDRPVKSVLLIQEPQPQSRSS